MNMQTSVKLLSRKFVISSFVLSSTFTSYVFSLSLPHVKFSHQTSHFVCINSKSLLAGPEMIFGGTAFDKYHV